MTSLSGGDRAGMKLIAIATEDFEVYYELVRALKALRRPFLSLSPSDPVPSGVGVVVTTATEEEEIDFRPKVVVPGVDEHSIRLSVRMAEEALAGRREWERIIFGIDPGKRIGLAVLGDGTVLHTAELHSPEELSEEVRRVLKTYPSREIRFRVGGGDPPNRNRIINLLLELGHPVEMADERYTSRGARLPHIRAAIDIALLSGPVVRRRLETVPKRGELNNVKRLSRIESQGAVTISDRLAERVVKGELTLDEAILRQRRRAKKDL
ncbi:MAG: hypothetical protein QW379_03860 [Thermoplasmata archaeon]